MVLLHGIETLRVVQDIEDKRLVVAKIFRTLKLDKTRYYNPCKPDSSMGRVAV